ncbi:lysine transporter LysE [Aureimonas altamirensis]|uniref:Lysine transporter LysE n=1 Tax=Aureimonas altamirensis TaxID=370622 RepID=A0A0B1Q8S0_9HYPH|nr:LysE family translocator [Aureimonas altamirensis]KHJ55771.1 lysine transporter LysE [Aureimonas altamirensis]
MLSVTQLLPFCIALAIAAAVPGPGVVALIARALGSGFGHGLAFAGGLILGDLTYLAAACFGLAMIAEAFGEFFVVVRIAASLYLAWLAFKLWRSAARPQTVEGAAGGSLRGSLAAGYLITLSNPKTIVFYLALLPTLMDLSHVSLPSFLMLACATVLVLTLVMTPYAALAARARGFMARPGRLERLNRSAAAILAATAVWTLVRRV